MGVVRSSGDRVMERRGRSQLNCHRLGLRRNLESFVSGILFLNVIEQATRSPRLKKISFRSLRSPSTLLPPSRSPIVLELVLIVGPKLFIEPGTKAFFRLSSVSGPGL